jgi:hypothetical protein
MTDRIFFFLVIVIHLMPKSNHLACVALIPQNPISDLHPLLLLLETVLTDSFLSFLPQSQVLPMTAEEVIMLSQKESLVSGNPYGSLDKNNTIVGVNEREDGLMSSAPTDLDLYTSHALASHLHHQHHHHHMSHHNHMNSSSSHNNSPQPTGLTVTTSSSSSSGTTTSSSHAHHPHVHFLPHQIQMLDSNEGILDPSIMGSLGNGNHTNSSSNTATLTRNTQQQYLKS